MDSLGDGPPARHGERHGRGGEGRCDDDAAAAAKTEELLKAMTLDEKVGQMTQVDLKAIKDKADIARYALGSVLSGGDSDPDDITAQGWARTHDELQSWALKSRLKIPAHLRHRRGARPQQRGRGGHLPAQHRPGRHARSRPGREGRADHGPGDWSGTGIRWAFAPCVAVARDERWGRTYESFGENPELAMMMGAAAVRGLQGPALGETTSVLACAKHFLGDGGTTRRRGPGQHRVRPGHAEEDSPARISGGHQGGRRLGHGLVQ